MGSTPHAHALADVKDPHDQGIVAMIGVFIDTIIVVTMTALVVISVLYVGNGPLATAYENAGRYTTVAEYVAAEGDAIVDGYTLDASGNLVDATGATVLTDADMKDPAKLAGAIGISKTNMAQIAFGAFMTESGGAVFVCICLLFFAFSTILSWNLFAKLNVQWLFRKRNDRPAVIVFALAAAFFVFLGTVLQNDIVWELQDMFNQLMVLPNAIALFALSGVVTSILASQKDRK
jgi:AGCS family alanine or glycine:cation symporter